MNLIEMVTLSFALAMDAFSVSICKGMAMGRSNLKSGILLSLSFGVFQAVMPVIGYLLAYGFADKIRSIDHWIVLVILVIIGGKMIIEGLRKEGCCVDKGLGIKETLGLSIATSIDAMAVGVGFAAIKVNLISAVCLIGVITFILCVLAFLIGKKIGMFLQNKAVIFGGLILIIIGVKVFLEHLSKGI